VVVNKKSGEVVVAIRQKDNVLLLNRNASELEDRLLRDELRVELGGNCFGIEPEDFVTDWDTGIVYVGPAARGYTRDMLEGQELN
jgi:hypothetical protein